MDQQYPTVAKIPILDIGKFEQWQFRIQQYLQHKHYAIWEVIEFRDSYEVPESTTTTDTTSGETGTKSGRTVTLTAEDMQKKKNDTGKKISIQGSNVVGFDKLKVECFNCHKMSHFARECRALRSHDRGRRDNYRQGSKAEDQAPKALMAIDGVGWDWSYMENDEEDHELVADEVASTEFALMANTSAESKVFDNSLCSKDCKKNDSLNSKITDLTDKLFDAKNMIYHYKLGLEQVESRLVEYKQREVKYCEKIKTLKFGNGSNNECIEILKKKIETLKQEKEGVDEKLAGLLTASKNLGNLIESQRSDKNKDGLRYSAVSPPPGQLYSSSKKDLSWTGLLEFADDIVTNYSRPSPTVESTSGDDQNRNPSVSETVATPITPKPFIKFVKPKDSQSKSKTDKTETPKKPPVKKRVKKSFTPKPVAHRPYRPPVRPVRTNMNGATPNRTSFNKQAHSYANRPFHKTSTVRSHYRAPWVPNINKNFPPVNRKFYTGSRKFPTANRKFPTTSGKFPAGSSKCSTADMGIKGKAIKPSACYWDSGCSRYMTGNISYLSDFEPFDGGYVSFGQGGCKITVKGTIKTGTLEFENVYFVKDLKYNLFSVSQIYDNKNSVLFTDSECIVLGRDFKLLDDANILLRTPRQHNMYSIDLNNIVPHRDLTCLVAKASADECMLWHRRLDEPASPLRDVSQREACPTDSGFIADQYRATIAKSSTLPYDSAPRVTSPAADEGSMQQTISKLTALCTSLQRQHSELLAKFQAQEVEINRLKERVKLLEDRDRVVAQRSEDDAPINRRSLDEGEAAAKRISNDSKEMATILTSMDAATVLAGGIADVPTGRGSIPTASPPADEVPTGSDVVPTASLIFATTTVVTLYRRRKGKEVMVESETPKKQRVQEQIDAHVARELEEQLERKDQRRSE
nr:ribonuclease H-like domain-containing protein [Tanacetum cinerariifolium]